VLDSSTTVGGIFECEPDASDMLIYNNKKTWCNDICDFEICAQRRIISEEIEISGHSFYYSISSHEIKRTKKSSSENDETS
jgi:hypothetical protein